MSHNIAIGYSADLRYAIENRNTLLMRRILNDSRVDPTIDDNVVLLIAVLYRDVPLVKQLLEDPRVDALNYIADTDNPEINELLAQWKYHPR